MTGISAGGIGSGLDVNSIVSQLVAAERAPADGRLDRTDRQLQAQISAIGTLRAAFGGLRTAVDALSSNTAALARKTSLPDGAGLTASAASSAAIGHYQVEVLALASAQKLSSGAYANADSLIGTGTLTLTSGTTNLSVVIDDTHNSLGGLRDAINSTAAGKGIVASIVQADDGAHLVLTALSTGTDNAITVAASGGDGGLAGLAYDPQGTTSLIELSAATDAQVKVDGLLRTSASNTITGLIDGVTLNLTRAEPGTQRELVVSGDPASQRSAARSFVNSYNASIASIATTTSYNPSTQVAAALNGDSLVRSASRDLRDQVSNQVTDLKAIGITINKDGTLTMDDAGFDAAMARDPAPASRLFTGDHSLARGLGDTLDRLLDAGGQFDGRSDALDRRTRSLANDRAALDRRMGQVEARYRAQFVALDGLVSKLQSTGNFLVQQLGLGS
ncbi:MAG: flagellar filament capping protein FliD [Luteimonas sp.]